MGFVVVIDSDCLPDTLEFTFTCPGDAFEFAVVAYNHADDDVDVSIELRE